MKMAAAKERNVVKPNWMREMWAIVIDDHGVC